MVKIVLCVIAGFALGKIYGAISIANEILSS